MGGTPKETLDRPTPSVPPVIPPPNKLLDIYNNLPCKTEIVKVIKFLKSRKVAGSDGIPSETPKAIKFLKSRKVAGLDGIPFEG